MKIYTKTGDDGTTGLIGGTRVAKHSPRIECYGTIDELNAFLGLLRDELDHDYNQKVIKIQKDLFYMGAELATDPKKATLKNNKDRLGVYKISQHDVSFLEQEIDQMDKDLSPMTHFIIPGGHRTVSLCHIARCICRRAERLTSLLISDSNQYDVILSYLNRLSDYLFVLARKLTKELDSDEIQWIPKKKA